MLQASEGAEMGVNPAEATEVQWQTTCEWEQMMREVMWAGYARPDHNE